MRILFFAPRTCWPLTTGARLRNFHLARQLGKRCSVTYVGLREPGEPEERPPADAFEASVILERERSYTLPKLIRGMLGPAPLTILNYYSSRAAVDLAKILGAGRFDAVQLESIHLIGYLPAIRADAGGPAVLADWHNIESELMWRYAATVRNLPRRLVAKRTASLIESAELRLLASCEAHTVASERECRTLADRRPGAALHVIPNGVDVEQYSGTGGQPDRRNILFVGSMDYQANIDAVLWFAREVWPELRAREPRLRFVVAGRDPAPEIKALASESIIITGTVEDVRPFYADALLMVVPIRFGSGTRLKILEAMAAGVAVVSTRAGAEGLEVVDRKHLLLADTAEGIVAGVGELAGSPELRRRLTAAGRELAASTYDWNILGERLYRIHHEMVERKRSNH